jgi:hypothetical protein
LLTKEEQEAEDSAFKVGCRLPRIKWMRIESTLGTININVGFPIPINIGKCSEKFKGLSWVTLVTNAGKILLNMEHDHLVAYNFLPCGFATFDLRGLKVKTTENPTCEKIERRKQEKEACKLKRISWARIESNLLPIGLNIDRKHVIGGCSKEFPRMEWARLVTDAGSVELDLNLNNEIIINAFYCGLEYVGAKVKKHNDCLPPQN